MKLRLCNTHMSVLTEYLAGVKEWNQVTGTVLQKMSFSMAKAILTGFYLKAEKNYAKYRNKPEFKFTMKQEEKAALLLFYQTRKLPAGDDIGRTFIMDLAGKIGKEF